MPSPKLTSLVLASLSIFALAAVTAGCAADTSDTDEDGVSAEDAIHAASGIEAATFKLYPEPNVSPEPFCDIHTTLDLQTERGARASLREVVTGFCKIAVFPDAREYRLRLAGTSCGSRIYTGRKRIDGVFRTITVTDHRTRVCRDLVPARVIVDETDRFGELHTKYSHDAAPAKKTSTWLTVAPRQCGDNPWNDAAPAPGQEPSYLQGEAGQVDDFFRAQGITLEQVGFAHPSEPRFVCMACSCPRGDALIVNAQSSGDAARLVAEYGFVEATSALTTSPTQCGTNPWEQLGGAGSEGERLASWAAGEGAPLDEVGFLSFTEPRMVCMACQCPRGDTAIAFPKDAAAATKLEDLGWKRVEN